MRPNIVTSSSALAALVLAQIAAADTLNVSPNGPISRIQDAIIAAHPGDEIVVAPGEYAEAIELLGKAIHVRSSGGPAVTTINATGATIAVRYYEWAPPWVFTAPPAVICIRGETRDTILEGFTIMGGAGRGVLEIWYPGLHFDCGGGMLNRTSDPTVINCVFTGNTAAHGGGIGNFGASPLIVNCVFYNNHAAQGGGIYSLNEEPDIVNCTFFNNDASGSGGAIHNSSYYGGLVTASLSNSILWGNRPEGNEVVDDINQFQQEQGVPGSIVSHCLIQHGAGPSVIDADPMFVAPPSGEFHAADVLGFRLAAGSPAADAGDNALLPGDAADLDRNGNRLEPLSRDIAGAARVMDDPAAANTGCGAGAIVDLGAFERTGALLVGDLNGDGRVNSADMAIMLASFGACPAGSCCLADLNFDGVVDATDAAILRNNMMPKVMPVTKKSLSVGGSVTMP